MKIPQSILNELDRLNGPLEEFRRDIIKHAYSAHEGKFCSPPGLLAAIQNLRRLIAEAQAALDRAKHVA